ncbi:hypothetical protein TNCV_5034711 [Trichonephila clavipes]|nr:hypothetical protein TNCV_5034711 [Trichonephila clavipes]
MLLARSSPTESMESTDESSNFTNHFFCNLLSLGSAELDIVNLVPQMDVGGSTELAKVSTAHTETEGEAAGI